MEKVWESLKAHPYIAGAGVVGAILVLYLIFARRQSAQGNTAGNNDYATEVAAATALQQAQMQAQYQSLQSSNQLSAAEDYYGMQEQLAKTTAGKYTAAQQEVSDSGIAASTAQTQIAANTQNFTTTATAAVDTSNINAQVAMYTAATQQAEDANTNLTNSQDLNNILSQLTTGETIATDGRNSINQMNAILSAMGKPQISGAASNVDASGVLGEALSSYSQIVNHTPASKASTSKASSGGIINYSGGGTYNPSTGLRTYGVNPATGTAKASHTIATGLDYSGAYYG